LVVLLLFSGSLSCWAELPDPAGMSEAEILEELLTNSLEIESLQSEQQKKLENVEMTSRELSIGLRDFSTSFTEKLVSIRGDLKQLKSKQDQHQETISQLQSSQSETKNSFESYVEGNEKAMAQMNRQLARVEFVNDVLMGVAGGSAVIAAVSLFLVFVL
jgi:chromosome segregation ATPase